MGVCSRLVKLDASRTPRDAARGLLVCGFVLAITILGCFWGRQEFLEAQGASNLEIDPAALDFGEVPAQKDFVWKLPLHNTTSTALRVLAVHSTCRCTQIEPRTFEIAPDGVVELRLRLDLRAKEASEAEEPLWPFAVEITPVVQDDVATLRSFRLQGTIRNAFALSESPVNFGDLILGSSLPPRDVTVRCNAPVTNATLDCRAPGFVTTFVRIPGANSYRFRIAPSEALPLGPFEFEATIIGSGIDRKQAALFPVRVYGRVLPDVQIDPPMMVLGTRTKGSVATDVIGFRSRTGKRFRVVETRIPLESANAGLQLECLSDAADAKTSYRITQKCEGDGSQLHRICFRVEQPDVTTQPYELPFIVSYHGVQTDEADLDAE